jgi:hypothetical protein
VSVVTLNQQIAVTIAHLSFELKGVFLAFSYISLYKLNYPQGWVVLTIARGTPKVRAKYSRDIVVSQKKT